MAETVLDEMVAFTGSGVQLRLPQGRGRSDSEWRAWIDELAMTPASVRVIVTDQLLSPTIQQHCVENQVHVRTLDQASPTAGSNVVVLADADDRPGRASVRRLVDAARAAPAALHWARVLPLDPDPDEAQMACVAVTDTLAARLRVNPHRDDTDVRRDLHRAARAARVPVTPHPAATVVRDWTLYRRESDPSAVVAEVREREAVISVAPGAPTGHPGSLPGTSLGALLADLDIPGGAAETIDGPLLSIITRTQGIRLQCLAENFDCLASQTVRDFEVVLACHRVDPEQLARLTELRDVQPEWLRSAIRIILVDRPGRSAPLNDALDVARGRYAVVLDDDDTVLSDWVATFSELEQLRPGAVLRAGAVRQDVVAFNAAAEGHQLICPVPVAAPTADWPADFSLVGHLHGNYSPCMTVAFPRGFWANLRQRFDETLDTTEDWHFLVRAAALLGVANSPRLTSVYRWWVGGGSSREAHDANEWARGREYVLDFLDGRLTILPPGAARQLEQVRAQSNFLAHEVALAAEANFALNDRLLGALEANSELNDRLINTLASHDRVSGTTRQLRSRLANQQQKVDRLRKQLRRTKNQDAERTRLIQQIIQVSPSSLGPGGKDTTAVRFDLPALRALLREINSVPPPGRLDRLRRSLQRRPAR